MAVLRPFNTYGPRQSARAVIPTIISQIAAGERKIKLGALSPTRDFTFVHDTAQGFIKAMECDACVGEAPISGRISRFRSRTQWRLLRRSWALRVEIVSDEERMRPADSEVERLYAGVDKARRLFGWAPEHGGRDGFAKGIAKTAEWFQDPTNLAAYKTGNTTSEPPMSDTAKFKLLHRDITTRVRGLLGSPEGFVPLHEPEFLGEEEALVLDCIRSGWVSSVGQYVDRFEAEIAAACGTAHGVAVVNGTAALEVALRVVGVMPGDEVLMPSLTFIATANATHHLGAVPHFVDAEARTLGLDPRRCARTWSEIADCADGVTVNGSTGRRLAAVVPMHVFGHPVDMDGLVDVARDFDLDLVEDAAESLGSRLGGASLRQPRPVAALSFNGNKILTTGGGGAV